MSLLIDIRMPEWMTDEALFAVLSPHLPEVKIHVGPPLAPLADVTMLATNQLKPDMAEMLPNLELVQKLGAGVETMLDDPNLAEHVRIARLEPAVQADEIAEYCLAEVLAELRNIRGYQRDQRAKLWAGQEPRRARETNVAVLGLGHIGHRIAEVFVANHFLTTGWSRSQKTIEGVTCTSGSTGLDQALRDADFVICILPSTTATRGFANCDFFAKLKPGAVFINVGRGDLVVDDDLLYALDHGHLAGAALDVFNIEPLPENHPFWDHGKVAVTPHVSGWSLGEGLLDVVENYKRLNAGQSLLREIDRKTGY